MKLIQVVKSKRQSPEVSFVFSSVTVRIIKPQECRFECMLSVKPNVNVPVYSLSSTLSSTDLTIYAPGIGTLSYAVSSPVGRFQHLRTLPQL